MYNSNDTVGDWRADLQKSWSDFWKAPVEKAKAEATGQVQMGIEGLLRGWFPFLSPPAVSPAEPLAPTPAPAIPTTYIIGGAVVGVLLLTAILRKR